MSLRTIILSGPPDYNIISHPSLAYVKVITVKREGQRQYQVESTPTGSEANVYHDKGAGKLVWSTDRKFARINVGSQYILEKVHIIIEE